MSEIALSLLIAIIKAFATEIAKAFASRTILRKKERIAPIDSRDDSENQ